MKSKILKLPAYTKELLLRVLPEPVRKPLRVIFRWAMKTYNKRQLQKDRQALSDVLQERAGIGPVIVFAPSLDWNTQLFQRPQQMALALARQGALVFYIQPKPDRKEPPFQQVLDRLYLCNTFAEAFDILDRPLVYILTWNYGYLELFNSPRVIYDFVDDIDVFYGDRDEIAQNHQRLIREADLFLVTAEKLYQEILPLREDALFCPNGVDYDHFVNDQQEQVVPPDDLSPILAEGKPVIGYYGALARWFDYDLLKELASLRPNYSFVLIGPDYDGTLIPAGLKKVDNVHWLGVKKYVELPSYLHYFDVATIPFIVSDITHATSPLKLFEYMAGGKPVVVTAMRESMRYDGVLVGRNPLEFALKLDQALELSKDPAYLQTLEQVACENTWDARARDVLDHLENHSHQPSVPAGLSTELSA